MWQSWIRFPEAHCGLLNLVHNDSRFESELFDITTMICNCHEIKFISPIRIICVALRLTSPLVPRSMAKYVASSKSLERLFDLPNLVFANTKMAFINLHVTIFFVRAYRKYFARTVNAHTTVECQTTNWIFQLFCSGQVVCIATWNRPFVANLFT